MIEVAISEYASPKKHSREIIYGLEYFEEDSWKLLSPDICEALGWVNRDAEKFTPDKVRNIFLTDSSLMALFCHTNNRAHTITYRGERHKYYTGKRTGPGLYAPYGIPEVKYVDTTMTEYLGWVNYFELKELNFKTGTNQSVGRCMRCTEIDCKIHPRDIEIEKSIGLNSQGYIEQKIEPVRVYSSNWHGRPIHFFKGDNSHPPFFDRTSYSLEESALELIRPHFEEQNR